MSILRNARQTGSLFIAGITICTASASAASSTQDFGPLKTYAQSPIQSTSLSPQLRSGFALPVHGREFYLNTTAASIWAETDEYRADYYQSTFSTGLMWQVTPGWQLELDASWRVALETHLDHLTFGFHRMFGIDLNGREDVPRHSFDISIPEYGVEYSDFKGETLTRTVTLYSGWQLWEQPDEALSLGASLYYNYVGSGPFHNHNFEQALQLNYSYHRDRHRFHTLLAGVYRHHPAALIPYNKLTYAAAAGWQYQFNGPHRFLLEYHFYEGATDATSALSQPSNEVLIGYRYHFTTSVLELILIENVFNMDNSPDVAITLGYRQRW
ncbi:DUF3187 family protein [Photobacterium sp. 1_MG-2023]|uniref:DUF3187 family protein n=1 Tax=Photobacterium sp. 1_MG-2023 TaxID=3062646 RepID=UPI0026E13668|nr:DUF3187 family protein [Photobacterium sp. 1_MG-2023]MDO6707253.1 DUF3187 family protein [Photobacterium sp. 1_MG-2023]